MAVVILTPLYSGTDSGHNIPLVERINGIKSHLQAQAPGVNIGYYGTTVRGAYNSWTIKHDIMLNVLGSLALVLLVIGICFPRYSELAIKTIQYAHDRGVAVEAEHTSEHNGNK